MAKFARAQISLDRDTGLPEDVIVNVMHFDGDDSQTWAEDVDDLAGRIVAFYQAIQTIYANTMAGTGLIKIYDLAEAEPRAPKFEQQFTFVPSGLTPLPAEVAIGVSFQGARVSGQPQARRRGRLFFGPLTTGSLGAVVAGQAGPRPVQVHRELLVNQLKALAVGPDPGDFRLAVYSPTTHLLTNDLDAAFEDVTSIWCDDEFDTQRRRGLRSSNRFMVTV